MAAKKLLLAAALTASALAAPVLEDRQNCGSTWTQCGGIGWSGATCCSSGNVCTEINAYYFQCLPGSQVTTTKASSTSPTSTSKASTTSKVTTSAGQPITTTAPSVPTTTIAGGASSTASFTGNPFVGVQGWANSYYSSEIYNHAIPSMTGTWAAKASAVAKVPTFQWLDRNVTIDTLMKSTLQEIRAANKAGANPPYAAHFVVYDLPERDCAAAASNGEFSLANNGINNYKTYINAIRKLLIEYSDIRTILVIEPDSLANLVTNTNVAKCANAASAYKECTNYAITQLDLPHVAQYLDAGHGGWLGWPANIQPAATLFADVYKTAGKPKSVRGLVTNVSNYNGWSLSSPPSYTTPNPNYDEKRYIEAFSPLLNAAGFPAQFIVDTGRSGQQPTGQIEQGDWCNAMGTGFGVRPTTNTGSSLADAFVWVKPGGESDGTSDTSAVRYDYHCGLSDALKPAPEAGQWFQAYFEQLLKNANPAF